MHDDISVRYRSIVLRYRDMVENREHFCYTVTTPLTLDEAVRRIGVERRDLVPADGVDTLAEEGYLLIG